MSPNNRRQMVIDQMEGLEAQGMGCVGCKGTCCTFEANSIMMNPLEAVELMTYLKVTQQNNLDLKERLQQNIKRYRLDQLLPTGRSSFRRTYTCPFFNHQELGCPLPRTVKPIGCLGFNSHHKELKAGEHCYAEKEVMQRRDDLFEDRERKLNSRLSEKLNLSWKKAPIPMALIELWDSELPAIEDEA